MSIHIDRPAASHIDAYIEYRRYVPDADERPLMSEHEFEQYKKKMTKERTAHRIYVSWRNSSTDMDCRQIGPQSMCFCGHRYIQHNTDNWKNKDIDCRQKGCQCTLFNHIPIRGSQDIKCHCKHSYSLHRPFALHSCRQIRCSCSQFITSNHCACGGIWSNHQTVFETRNERLAGGRPVENLAFSGNGYAALGGVTSFTSLLDGADLKQLQLNKQTSSQTEEKHVEYCPSESKGAAKIELLSDGSAIAVNGKMNEQQELSFYEKSYQRSNVSRPRFRSNNRK